MAPASSAASSIVDFPSKGAKADKRGKFTVPAPASLAEAETLMGRMAAVAKSRAERAAAMDRELAAIRLVHEPQLADEKALMDAQLKALEEFAARNLDLFKEKRSVELIHGTMGFRLGQWRLVVRAKMTWEKVLERVKGFRGGKFTRIKDEVNRESLLAEAREGDVSAGDLEKLGLRLAQDENFYAELKQG